MKKQSNVRTSDEIKTDVVRRCTCGGELKPIESVTEFVGFLYKNASHKFFCRDCKKTILIPDAMSMMLNMLTLLVAIAIVVVGTLNGYWNWILGMFDESMGMAILGMVMSFIIVILVVGGLSNGKNMLFGFQQMRAHPVIDGADTGKSILKFLWIMLYGTFPWVLLIGMGFLNDMYFHFDRDSAIFLVLPGLSPIFFAQKVGISIGAAFFATAFYPVVGFVIMFLT